MVDIYEFGIFFFFRKTIDMVDYQHDIAKHVDNFPQTNAVKFI